MLLTLSMNKRIALSRIAPAEIKAFLSRYNNDALRNMSREDVRRAVCKFLGDEEITSPAAPDQSASFAAALNAINAMRSDSILRHVAEEISAANAIRAGMGLLGAGLEYQKAVQQDVEKLQAIKVSLLHGVQEIETVINDVACNTRNGKS